MSDKKEPLITRVRTWYICFKRRNHSRTFLNTCAEVALFKQLVSKQPCTACGQNGLILDKFVRNPRGWDAEVSCGNCNFHAVINSEGFDFKEVSSRGKARE